MQSLYLVYTSPRLTLPLRATTISHFTDKNANFYKIYYIQMSIHEVTLLNLAQRESLMFTVQGYNPIFMTSFNRIPAPVNVTAQIALPAKVSDSTGFCSK